MENRFMEKVCNKIVDAVCETFTKKYYFVAIFQLKNGHVYLIVRKKRGRVIGEEKQALHKKIFDVALSIFDWYCKKHEFFNTKIFFNPKLFKEFSGYHFHYF